MVPESVPWYCTCIADPSYFNYAYEALAVSPVIFVAGVSLLGHA